MLIIPENGAGPMPDRAYRMTEAIVATATASRAWQSTSGEKALPVRLLTATQSENAIP